MKKNFLTHAGIVVVLFMVAAVFLSPVLGGKIVRQGDIEHYEAMSYSQKAEKRVTGKTPHWNQSMFSGMPGYQITNDAPKQVFQKLTGVLTLRHLGWDRNIGVIFLYLLGFYVALLAFGLNPWLALVGALGFGLGSYNIIIIAAGHITKAWAMSMMAPVMAGMFMTLRAAVDDYLEKRARTRRLLWGGLLFTLALILQISFNHIQITFYTGIGCVLMGVAYLVYACIKRRFVRFALHVGVLVLGAGLAFGCNVRLLLVNEEYAKYTMRGGGELTIDPEGNPLENNNAGSDGLDMEYAYRWSYGIDETYTLLVPGAMGGGNSEPVSEESEFYKNFRQRYAPLYWGGQPSTAGPVYFGAIIVLLFFMGLIVTKGPERWWLLAATLLAILLSWGKNLPGVNEWVFNNVPLYNKFRTPSMALVLANVCMALLAALTLKTVLDPERNRKRINMGIYVSAGGLVLLIIGVLLASGGFSFSGTADVEMENMYGERTWGILSPILLRCRTALFTADSWRSIAFIVLTAAVLWLYNNDKLKLKWVTLAIVGLMIVIDLWGVDRRYMNDDNYTEVFKTALRKAQYDNDIDQQAQYYGDHDFRVYNRVTNTFNDAIPSAFHNQIGGYSPAKLNRYQDIISYHIAYGNAAVLNMLNMRYVVVPQGNQAVVMRNPDALGNAWFVSEVKAVGSPDEEIMALRGFNPATTAVVDTSQWSLASGHWPVDSSATITLELNAKKNSDYLKYTSHSESEQLAVFSEIHYEPDWFAYIDGKPADYIRANYVLRAMVIPAGDHVIEFKNEAPRFNKLDNMGLMVSIITLLAMVGAVVLVYRKSLFKKGTKKV